MSQKIIYLDAHDVISLAKVAGRAAVLESEDDYAFANSLKILEDLSSSAEYAIPLSVLQLIEVVPFSVTKSNIRAVQGRLILLNKLSKGSRLISPDRIIENEIRTLLTGSSKDLKPISLIANTAEDFWTPAKKDPRIATFNPDEQFLQEIIADAVDLFGPGKGAERLKEKLRKKDVKELAAMRRRAEASYSSASQQLICKDWTSPEATHEMPSRLAAWQMGVFADLAQLSRTLGLHNVFSREVLHELQKAQIALMETILWMQRLAFNAAPGLTIAQDMRSSSCELDTKIFRHLTKFQKQELEAPLALLVTYLFLKSKAREWQLPSPELSPLLLKQVPATYAVCGATARIIAKQLFVPKPFLQLSSSYHEDLLHFSYAPYASVFRTDTEFSEGNLRYLQEPLNMSGGGGRKLLKALQNLSK